MKKTYQHWILLLISLVPALLLAETRPNIMILMLDDAGWTDLSSFGSRIQTQNMDHLASEGMKFTDCHAGAPNCSPSRTGMLTGRSPIRAGIYNYLDDDTPMHLRSSEITIANLLHDAGYATGHFGKWHVSKLNSSQSQPKDLGFDYSLGTDNNAEPSHLNPVNFIRNGKELGKIQGYSCDIVADEAIAWIKNQQKKDKDQPFFTCVWFHEPHQKIASPPELVAEYQKRYPDIDQKTAMYFANVANADQAVGRIMETLKSLKLEENTVVFFASDNGPLNEFSRGELRGLKSFVWEGGHRVPGIFRWPGKIKAGSVSDETIGFFDLLPTFCDIAGVDLPKNRTFDGTSIRSLLTGGGFKRENPLFWFFYRVNPSMALRSGDWLITADTTDKDRKKSHALAGVDIPLIKSSELIDFELYNLRTDLGQNRNVAAENPKVLKQLEAQMIRLHKEIVTEGPFWDIPADPKKK